MFVSSMDVCVYVLVIYTCIYTHIVCMHTHLLEGKTFSMYLLFERNKMLCLSFIYFTRTEELI